MDKLTRYQATLQLMNLIKTSKADAQSLLPDLEILSLDDVEKAAADFRARKSHMGVSDNLPAGNIFDTFMNGGDTK